MAAPLSQELESLLNPQPRFWDPEDDQDEATSAKVIEKFDEGEIEDDDSAVILKNLKKHSTSYLSDTDKRYQGKATSRKDLRAEFGEPSFSGDSDEELLQGEEGNSISELGNSDEEKRTDTEDDDFEEEDMEEEDDEAYDENQSADEDSNEEGETVEQNDLDKSELQDGIQAFSKEKVSADVAKGQGIRNQIAIWDQLLEGRIKIQKALLSVNQLPQHSTFALFMSKGGSELASPLLNSYKAVKDLMRSLTQLQDELLFQFPETRYLIDGKNCSVDSDEEIPSDEEMENDDSGTLKSKGAPKRKLKMREYSEFMEKRFADFKTYRNTTLQKWHDKTKLSGKISKVLGGSDRSIPMQIEQIMMDKERLLRRTQTKRSSYTILGKSEPESAPVQESALNEEMDIQVERKSNAQVKDLDEEIFDDDDFYHQLLRELIERRTSSVDPNDQVAMGRQWLAIQKLRSKIKKKVDTKASKGRKVRYQVHNKLVSFMAPIGHSTMNDEARTELYQSLFGKIKHLEPEKSITL